MYHKCKVVMLSTNEKAPIFLYHLDGIENGLACLALTLDRKMYSTYKPQHLYILSNEEIMVGDWYYTSLEHDNPFIRQCKIIDKSKEYWLDNDLKYQGNLKSDYGSYKITASTDSFLTIQINNPEKMSNRIYKSLPSPSQSFIEKYVSEYNKGNIITDVMVEYEEYNDYPPVSFMPDILKVNPKDNTIIIKKIKDSWNREEVTKLCKKAYKDASTIQGSAKWLDNEAKEWVEENL
jgi:hypothetical protein